MKFLKYAITSLIMSVAILAFAGGDSSAGGNGGGSLHLFTGFADGRFSITVASEQNGDLVPVLKYYILAGATKEVTSTGNVYTIAEDSTSAIIVSKRQQSDTISGIQLNMTLALAELREMDAGSPGTNFTFSGSFAETLYKGMTLSGLKKAGVNLGNNNEVVGNSYSDAFLYCATSTRGTLCTFRFTTKK